MIRPSSISAAEYEAATRGVALVHRADRVLVRVHGRAPAQMLQGILTQSVSSPPEGDTGDVRYGALLTPKGRMQSDLKQFWFGPTAEDGVALDLPKAGLEGVQETFRRSLPPRFAKVEVEDGLALVTVLGPEGAAAVGELLGRDAPAGYLIHGGGVFAGGLLVSRGLRQPDSWDIWVGPDHLDSVVESLSSAGVHEVSPEAFEVLRVEGGFPWFGTDMTEETIPIEAGLENVAFDHGKGCYTGQEVIVRILHRGHVNRHLRFLRMGDFDARSRGEESGPLELFTDGREKPVGWVTSVVQSPRFGETIGLGYVRREVEPPASVHVGAATGPAVRVLEGPPPPGS